MLFLTLYLPLKYLFFNIHTLYDINDVIVANLVCDTMFFTVFILFKYKFIYVSKVFLIFLENVFWVYFIYKNVSSISHTLLLVLFIMLCRYIFMYMVNSFILLIILCKEIIFFTLIILLKTSMSALKIDFLSFMFSLLSYYLSFGNINNFIISLLINLFVILTLYIIIKFVCSPKRSATSYILNEKWFFIRLTSYFLFLTVITWKPIPVK